MNKYELMQALAIISDSEDVKVGDIDITGVEIKDANGALFASLLTGDKTIAALEQDVARKTAEVEKLAAEIADKQSALDAAAAEKAAAELLLAEATK